MGLVSLSVGVAVGYVIGTRTGRSGLDKARRSASDAWNSPEVQETVQGAVSSAGDTASKLAQDVAETARRSATAAVEAVRQGAAEASEFFDQEFAAQKSSDPTYHAPETAPTGTGDVVTDPGLSTEKEGTDWAHEGGSPGNREGAGS